MAFRLIPREEKFYTDFQALAAELQVGARLLEAMLAADGVLYTGGDWAQGLLDLTSGAGVDVVIDNRSSDVSACVLIDGHRVSDLPPGAGTTVRLAAEQSRLATLPEHVVLDEVLMLPRGLLVDPW